MSDTRARSSQLSPARIRSAQPVLREILRLGALVVLVLTTACAGANKHADDDTSDSNAPSVAGVALEESAAKRVVLESIALRVYDLDAMTAFYSEAFDIQFSEVETFGVTSHFGDFDGMTLKLVPIRESADFVGFPEVQLGFEVPDIDTVFAIAERHGGKPDGKRRVEAGLYHAGLRDPDGNTIELYQRR